MRLPGILLLLLIILLNAKFNLVFSLKDFSVAAPVPNYFCIEILWYCWLFISMVEICLELKCAK